jgi:membrane protein DedA with SNARE-associated domain
MPFRPPAATTTEQVACGAGIAAGVAASYAFAALTPELIAHHDLLLETLNGGITSIVTAGALARVDRMPLLLAVLAPLVGILSYDVFYWWAGRLWGDRIVATYTAGRPRRARWVARGEALVRRRGVWAMVFVYYLPIPNPVTEVLCGISGMRLAVFIVGDIIGTLLWEALLLGLGWSIGRPAVHAVTRISHDAIWITVAIVVVVAVVGATKSGRQRRLDTGSPTTQVGSDQTPPRV